MQTNRTFDDLIDEAAGLEVISLEQASLPMRFHDIAAVVMLRARSRRRLSDF